MRPPLHARLAWSICGFGGAAGVALLAGGVRGAILTLIATAFLAARLIQAKVPGRGYSVFGVLIALNGFLIWLAISPPCDFSDPATTSITELEDGSFSIECKPRGGGWVTAAASLVGTAAILGLVALLGKERRREGRTAARRREPPSPRVRVAALCGVAALVASFVAAAGVLSQNDWSPTALVRMAKPDPIARYAVTHDPTFALFSREAHYDGVYFYAIGADPLALGRAHELIDMGVHRYTHPLYGWLAWLGSLGDPGRVPHALLGINLVAMAIAGAGLSLLSVRLGISGWSGLLVAVNPGLIASVSFDTAEPVGAALLVLSLGAWLSGKRGLGAIGFLLVCLTRQPFAVIPIAIAIWEIFSGRGKLPFKEIARRVAFLAAGPLAMAGWQLYLFGRFEELPFATGQMVLTFPFEGWAEGIRFAGALGGGPFAQVGLPSLALLVASLVAALATTYVAIARPTFLGAIFLGLMVIYFCLEQLAIVFPKELLRFSAIPWLVLPLLFLQRTRDEDRSELVLA